MDIAVRPAQRSDAAALARLVDLAGEGLPSHLWAGMAEAGEDVWTVGARRLTENDGAFAIRNAVVAEIGGGVVGGLVSYRIGDRPEPLGDLPPIVRPLQALENRALGSHYVNILATFPAFRGRGIATRLMGEAERRGAGAPAMSLIVAEGNTAARRLYAGLGYREQARAPIVKNGWVCPSDEWVLMVKPLPRPDGSPAPASEVRFP